MLGFFYAQIPIMLHTVPSFTYLSISGLYMKQSITLILLCLLCLPTVHTYAQAELESNLESQVEAEAEFKPAIPTRDRSVQLNLEAMAVVKAKIANQQLSPAAQKTYTQLLNTYA